MANVLVIGGFGFYGARVASRLQGAGHRVSKGTRTPGAGDAVRVDLAEPGTFTAFADVDYVVNCSDTVGAPPDDAIGHVLAEGGVWLEMGADGPTVQRLLELTPRDPVGTVLLGVGVFPGLSTALARAVAEDGPPPSTLELGIRLSPLSGAGPGNCALMAESLFVPASRIEGGALVHARSALGPVIPLPYGGMRRASVNLALPDTALIHRATGVPNVGSHMALVPGFLRFNFTVLAWVCALLRPLRGPLVALLTFQLAVVRAWLLRRVESDLRIVVVADRGEPSQRSRELHFRDGQESTAVGVLGAVEACVGRGPLAPGIRGVAEEFTLAQLTVGR